MPEPDTHPPSGMGQNAPSATAAEIAELKDAFRDALGAMAQRQDLNANDMAHVRESLAALQEVVGPGQGSLSDRVPRLEARA
ncbi:MAG TPA: hypothetical protein VF576_00075, partial [Rubricoccaceae bacterium]